VKIRKFTPPGSAARGKAVKDFAVTLGSLAVPEVGMVKEAMSSGLPWWGTIIGIAAIYILRRR
jgi:hypothetical protein